MNIEGTSVYKTLMGAKRDRAAVRVFDTCNGYAALSEHEGFSGSPSGARMCFSAHLVAVKRDGFGQFCTSGKWEATP